jgi:subtilase-type serine protease
MPGALRPQTSYLLAFLALAGSGALAGAALADGLPPVLPTSVGPTTPAPPAVSVTTPVATATLSLPTVSAPAVTTPTATTPPVTAPTATVPSVTTPVVTTPAAATPSLTTPAVTTPAVTTPVSVSPPRVVRGAVHAVTTASSPIVQAATTRKAPVPLPEVTTPAVTLPTRAAAGTVIAAGGGTTGSTLPFNASVAALVPQPQPDRLSASPLRATALIADVPIAHALIANGIEGAPPVTAVTVLRSPLVATLVAGVARSRDGSTPSRQLPANRTSGAGGWSGAARDPVTVAGGLALLVALLGLGAAAAARSSTGFVAACAELERFPFPRFRVLPCDRLAGGRARATDAASFVGGGTAASADVTAAGRRVVPRMAQVLGAQAHSAVAPAMRAWELLKTIVLTILVAANGLLLAIRWQLGRWQSR